MVYPHCAEAQRSPWTYESPINGHAYCDYCLSAELAFEPTNATERAELAFEPIKATEATMATRTAITV